MNTSKLSFLNYSIGQLGFVVKSVDETIENYYKKFGIQNWKIYTYGAPLLKFMHYQGETTNYKMRIALSYFGDTRIEIIQPLEGPTIYEDFIQKHNYGLQHLGIYVKDIETELTLVKQQGFKVVMDGGGFGLDGDGSFAYLNTEEIYGICYELIQRPLHRTEPEKFYPELNQDVVLKN
ncbi:MAG: VOC family protein [Sphaerochaetaceae bacterium]|jgi:hypothetical protein